jgi:hypothetical protein
VCAEGPRPPDITQVSEATHAGGIMRALWSGYLVAQHSADAAREVAQRAISEATAATEQVRVVAAQRCWFLGVGYCDSSVRGKDAGDISHSGRSRRSDCRAAAAVL